LIAALIKRTVERRSASFSFIACFIEAIIRARRSIKHLYHRDGGKQ
jgi:hypothetical protein